ncbi:MAG TPA: hypothetical protein VGY32_10400 [Solirubrobacteraceae bacterium]|nr:hypothetical protein [Solirubrobacteraceae bacterium]
MSDEPRPGSSWVPAPPEPESEQPTREVSAVPVTPPPPGLDTESPAELVDEPAPVTQPEEPAPVTGPEPVPEAEGVPEPVAEVEAATEPEPEPVPQAEAEPEPVAEPEAVLEPEPEPEPAVVPEVAPAEVAAAIPSPHAHPLSPEPATAGHTSWETPKSNSVPATPASGGSRPELVLAAGFVGGLLLAQVVKRIAK